MIAMDMKAERRRRALRSVAGIVASFVVCFAPWPCRDQRYVDLAFSIPFATIPHFYTPEVKAWCLESSRRWHNLHQQVRYKFIMMNQPRLAEGFLHAVARDLDASQPRLHLHSYNELVRACQHALGDDIIVEQVGSLTRRTASSAERDMDLQVRRCPGSDEAAVLFTETDKCKVAQNLEKLICVTGPVTIGNVAIKFIMEDFLPVDLVLANPRTENFPKLRGGEDFYQNSARINEFLTVTPAARAAITGVKHFFAHGRPKGILLEAIVWRFYISQNYPQRNYSVALDGLDDATRRVILSKEFFIVFDHVLTALKNWDREDSPFGNDLKEDLEKLPERKRDEYVQGLEKFRRTIREDLGYLFLFHDIFKRARDEWRAEDGPFHSYLEKRFREFFPYD